MTNTATNSATTSKMEILDKGMRCLTEMLGVIDTERFISFVNSEQFDYTNWQREYFDTKTPEEIDKEMLDYIAANPYKGDASTII